MSEEQCCVITEGGLRCPDMAQWVTWNLELPYYETYNYYCNKHLIDGLSLDAPFEVWPAKLFEP